MTRFLGLIGICLLSLCVKSSFANNIYTISIEDDSEWDIDGPLGNCTERIYVHETEIEDTTTETTTTEAGGETETEDRCDEILVTVDEGYQIKVTVKYLEIDATEGYLLVKSGTPGKDGLDGRIFAHTIKSPREYVSVINSVYIKLFSFDTNNPVTTGSFSLIVSRIGDGLPDPTTTTTERWPTPPPDEPGYMVVNITVPDRESNGLVDLFRENVANMATKYCPLVNITLKEDLTSEDVRLISIVQCPINWPKRDTCMQVNFSVPIVFPEEENEETLVRYELTSANLKKMWALFSDGELDPEFSNYERPSTNFILWLGIICATILLFSIILYLIKKIGYKLSGFNIKHKPLDNERSDVLPANSPHHDELRPHIRQMFPPMFESERQYFEP